ncbi:hypothetical protein PILCRDRAFT_11367 [Piloderma croceum F 1598]|uniref:Uncharacterized protein n=1 Tax=Piloderma croceum (strain F 1598) TaxID=765440 RepID=A0A0C3BLG2_PILCF|nr:hypothetical protein PILCRDRAFT_11367 [Piloderma croceum F 1598]
MAVFHRLSNVEWEAWEAAFNEMGHGEDGSDWDEPLADDADTSNDTPPISEPTCNTLLPREVVPGAPEVNNDSQDLSLVNQTPTTLRQPSPQYSNPPFGFSVMHK